MAAASLTFGLNPGAYVSVTAPTIIVMTPLGAGETFPPTMTVIPAAVPPVTVPLAVNPLTAAAEPAASTPPAAPWSVTFTEKT